jgi:hypothetical protein
MSSPNREEQDGPGKVHAHGTTVKETRSNANKKQNNKEQSNVMDAENPSKTRKTEYIPRRKTQTSQQSEENAALARVLRSGTRYHGPDEDVEDGEDSNSLMSAEAQISGTENETTETSVRRSVRNHTSPARFGTYQSTGTSTTSSERRKKEKAQKKAKKAVKENHLAQISAKSKSGSNTKTSQSVTKKRRVNTQMSRGRQYQRAVKNRFLWEQKQRRAEKKRIREDLGKFVYVEL